MGRKIMYSIRQRLRDEKIEKIDRESETKGSFSMLHLSRSALCRFFPRLRYFWDYNFCLLNFCFAFFEFLTSQFTHFCLYCYSFCSLIFLFFLFSDFTVIVEGYGIQDVMGRPGVDGKHTKTNHIVEVK